MACLVKDRTRGSPYWYCAYTAPDGRRLKKSTKQTDRAKAWEVCVAFANAESLIATRSATQKQLHKVINAALLRIGEQVLAEPTIREVLDNWIASKKGAVSKSTLDTYEYGRDLLVSFLGPRAGRSVRMLSKADVIAFRNHLLKEGRTPSTVNGVVKRYLTGPFESARKEGLIDYNPFAAVDALKAPRVEKDVFEPEQVAELVQVAQGTDWEGAILVGYTTGMRLGDVANLQWSSIDIKNGLLCFVQRKGERPALIGLHRDLEDYLTRRPAPDDPKAYVFPSLANRSTGGQNGLSMAFERIMERAGVCGRVLRERTPGGKARTVRSLSFHSFRHGAATAVFKNAALKDIARRVTAHAGRGVIDRYIHEDIEAIREATKLIPRLPRI
jgi:integrase